MVVFHKIKDNGTVSHSTFSCKGNTRGRATTFLNILRWFFLHEKQNPILENNFRSPLTCYMIQNSRLLPICFSTHFFFVNRQIYPPQLYFRNHGVSSLGNELLSPRWVGLNISVILCSFSCHFSPQPRCSNADPWDSISTSCCPLLPL